MHVRQAFVVAVATLVVASCGKGDNSPKKVEPCGNGIIDFAETCDTAIESGPGACPTECPTTGDPCNEIELIGSATSCTAECAPIERVCGADDQCCPQDCTDAEDADCAVGALCGNGQLDAGETCDPAIGSGLSGACECPSINTACVVNELQGSPATCQHQCVEVTVTACDSGDGCCPSGCDSQSDSDCGTCGNGIVEGSESCDGNCPTFCDDGDACTLDSLSGNAATCDAVCTATAINACVDSDGCCPSNCTPATDNDCVAVCGNGTVEIGETCDGNCPTSCDDGDACTVDQLVGSPSTCDAECSTSLISSCVNGDGCCPNGCSLANDSDCVAVCGNGVVETPETCDSNCPAVCDDGDACTTNVRSGSDASCNVSCAFVAISACLDNDGCCPGGCNSTNDNDCSATCGNSIREGTETCDGNCPTSCNDANACTTDVLSGNAASCTAVCMYPPITACTDGDGCCPTGCAFVNDDDCPCIPNTCASLGLTCGTLVDDGCGGGGEVCGTCMAGRSCVANQCQLDYDVGDACVSDGDCAGAAGICVPELTTGWDDGYCIRVCATDAECGAPNHCNADSYCVDSCTSDSDCRAGYQCFDADADGRDECAPVATGTGAVGDPCARYADCAGGAAGWCATAASQFKGGFCSSDCAVDSDCSAGSHCWNATACVPDCASAADCRGNGYDCFDSDGDGTDECYRSANGTGAIGDTCAGMWDCSGGQWGWCELALDGYSGGYCTVFCGTGLGSCGGQASCWFDGESDICLDNCQNNNQCRTNYVCTDPGAVGRSVCHP